MNWQLLGLSATSGLVAEMLMGTIGTFIKTYPRHRIEEFLVRAGVVFGPAKLGRHWSQLSADEQEAWLKILPWLSGTHSDFIKPFQWIPRTLFFWEGLEPDWDDALPGTNAMTLLPIPGHGETLLLRGYMASTTVEGIHDRLGWRWDDNDHFYELSVSLKGVK